MRKKLRSGYTTGACAAAAAKAAVVVLLSEEARKHVSANAKNFRSSELPRLRTIDIPFPDGRRHKFKIEDSRFKITGDEGVALASVIKDAGDDPDVTNGAEIVAEARIQNTERRTQSTDKSREKDSLGSGFWDRCSVFIKGGKGVGTVTKPGLPVPIGEAAINPVPRKMIEEAVMEAIDVCRDKARLAPTFEITISVPQGEELAKKTLNHRLGIEGGISILGTTGIVKPVSAEAWTATISSSMDVARATGQKEIVLSAGRTSEKAHMNKYNSPEEAYVLMGDYLEYALKEAVRHGFKKVHLCAQWAKMVKIAMATPQTHVRFGAIDIKKAVEFLEGLGVAGAYGNTPLQDHEFNTAREIFDYIMSEGNVEARPALPLQKVCNAAKKYAEQIGGGLPVRTYLISYEKEIIAHSE